MCDGGALGGGAPRRASTRGNKPSDHSVAYSQTSGHKRKRDFTPIHNQPTNNNNNKNYRTESRVSKSMCVMVR